MPSEDFAHPLGTLMSFQDGCTYIARDGRWVQIEGKKNNWRVHEIVKGGMPPTFTPPLFDPDTF